MNPTTVSERTPELNVTRVKFTLTQKSFDYSCLMFCLIFTRPKMNPTLNYRSLT